MFDLIDRARHWLIRKLSCGDMVLINFEMAQDRRFRPKNAGPSLIDGAEFAVDKNVSSAVLVSRIGPFDDCGLGLQVSSGLTISRCDFRGV